MTYPHDISICHEDMSWAFLYMSWVYMSWGYVMGEYLLPMCFVEKTLHMYLLYFLWYHTHYQSTDWHIADRSATNMGNINVWVHRFTSNTLFWNPPKGFVSTPSLRTSRYGCLPHTRIFSNLNLPLQNMDPGYKLWINLNNREWYGPTQWISGDVVDDKHPL